MRNKKHNAQVFRSLNSAIENFWGHIETIKNGNTMKHILIIFPTLLLATLAALHASDATSKNPKPTTTEQWAVFETSFTSGKNYSNPFMDVEVYVIFQQGEKQWKVPAFWAGNDK